VEGICWGLWLESRKSEEGKMSVGIPHTGEGFNCGVQMTGLGDWLVYMRAWDFQSLLDARNVFGYLGLDGLAFHLASHFAA
jgi:hypothetical protein